MHTFSETGSAVPAFLAKLWRLVDDPETNNLIYWSKDGRSFVIQNQAQFAHDLLPLNYKHNNMASFIRQLNMYGFHKITSIDNGGLKFDRDEMEFSHPYFKRGFAQLLEHIKRKIATTKQPSDEKSNSSSSKTESVGKVLTEVKAMRGRQESLDSRFMVMKQENEALWRELATLRQKHMKQQQIVNKLIQFLVTMVQPSRNMTGVKRHFQLMINDAPHSSKMRKASEGESGPIIHELTEELLDGVAEEADDDLLDPNMPSGFEINVQNSPQSNVNPSYGNSNQNASDPTDIQNKSSPENVYYVSETAENCENSVSNATNDDENVLNTPLVKKEMARNQQLQQHLQQQQQQLQKEHRMQQQRIKRRKPATVVTEAPTINTKISSKKMCVDSPSCELDPLYFLDVDSTNKNECLDSGVSTTDEQEFPSALTIPQAKKTLSENSSPNQQFGVSDKQLFNSNDFINDEMPVDIFEDTDAFNKNILNESNMDEARKDNLAVTKYNTQKSLSNEEILRLSTADDVTSHLDNVQDDLDNLKDLLRSEGYSLDANALLGNGNPTGNNSSNRLYLPSPLDNDILTKLFTDSDLINSYHGMSYGNDDHPVDNKKGSELMTYQPYYSDFSDILNMNSESQDFEDKSSKPLDELSSNNNSGINTPRPDQD